MTAEPREVAAFRAECTRLAADILVSPAAYAVAHLARLAIGAQQAQIARLDAELDAYQGRTVYHCADAALETAATASTDAHPGDVLRATDTGRELVCRGPGRWEPR